MQSALLATKVEKKHANSIQWRYAVSCQYAENVGKFYFYCYLSLYIFRTASRVIIQKQLITGGNLELPTYHFTKQLSFVNKRETSAAKQPR